MHRKLPFKLLFATFIFSLFIALPGSSNNLVVSNVSLTGQNEAEDYAFIRFDISWENSWRTSVAPNNWDAAWIFAKYRVGSGPWNHVTLSSTGHIAPAGSTISAPADNVGVFLYRDADGTGTFNKTGVKLRWDYGINGIGDNDEVEVKVFGIEMVYVPQGAFYVGGTIGSTELGRFYTYPNENTPYLISTEAEITVGIIEGNLYYLPSSPPPPPDPTIIAGDHDGPIPAAYPKGYNAFYVMKHEVPHSAYVDFLNCLTRDQQNARTRAQLPANTTTVVNRYVMVQTDAGSFGSETPERRSSIRCDATIPATGPLTFYCDLNYNNAPNQADDGQDIACIYPSWSDAMAYLDWTGLRPMTELEFEKSCRGTSDPVSNEYAWGTSTIVTYSTLINAGTANETSSTVTANATTRTANILAPTRVGMFAKTGNTRVQSGATFYGILDMTGNLWERPVTVGNPQGRSYTGKHGNGTITPAGKADVEYWPTTEGIGSGYRGGYWNSQSSEKVLCTADRQYAAQYSDRRRERYGIRGVRTATAP